VQDWRRHQAGAGRISAAVNVSGRQFVAADFPDIVEAAIHAAGIDPGAVHLELTETVLMDRPDLPQKTLKRLHALGVGLSIDDFGTGYSSLSYLKWLSARTLKIDRTFVEELGRGPHGATIIEAVLHMADTLQLDVVAEGVETREQVAELRRLGVRYAQGFFWSQPLSPEHIPAWLETTPFRRPTLFRPPTL
jgi:EAL domain-containing protein (putative c-di-GMP-specific phosphodiesterase class I)